MPVQTDCEIKANRLEIVIKNKKQKRFLLINTSVQAIEKSQDLVIEIKRM